MEQDEPTFTVPKKCPTPGCPLDVYTKKPLCSFCEAGRTKIKKKCLFPTCEKMTHSNRCRTHTNCRHMCTYVSNNGVRCTNYGIHPLFCHTHKRGFSSDTLSSMLNAARLEAEGGATSAAAPE